MWYNRHMGLKKEKKLMELNLKLANKIWQANSFNHSLVTNKVLAILLASYCKNKPFEEVSLRSAKIRELANIPAYNLKEFKKAIAELNEATICIDGKEYKWFSKLEYTKGKVEFLLNKELG